MCVDYNPYEGQPVQGVPDTVLLRGRVLVQDGRYLGDAPGGQFLKRSLFSDGLL
jgi:dihydropyrimidinase